MKDLVWGARMRPEGDTHTSIIGKTAEEFGMLAFWDAAQLMDYAIQPFRCVSTSEGSASQGLGISYIEEGRQLKAVNRDEEWVEAATGHVMTEFRTSQRLDTLAHWDHIKLTLELLQRPRECQFFDISLELTLYPTQSLPSPLLRKTSPRQTSAQQRKLNW